MLTLCSYAIFFNNTINPEMPKHSGALSALLFFFSFSFDRLIDFSLTAYHSEVIKCF